MGVEPDMAKVELARTQGANKELSEVWVSWDTSHTELLYCLVMIQQVNLRQGGAELALDNSNTFLTVNVTNGSDPGYHAGET